MDSQIQEKFSAIEDGDVWGYDHQGRAAGTAKLRRQLLTFLEAENIGSILDLPCGHFTWQSTLLLEAMDPSGEYADKTLSIWKRSALHT
jgi:hypothetical protein